MLLVDQEIENINNLICKNIKRSKSSSRGEISQIIISQLRNLVEAIMVKIDANGANVENSYEKIKLARKNLSSMGSLKVLNDFHRFLQMVASHYTFDEENSERLMLKYYQYLFQIRNLMFNKYGMSLFENLEEFPIHTDPNLQEYYAKIAEKIEEHEIVTVKNIREKYYIQKLKPFFVDRNIYYEITFTSAGDNIKKTDRIIAFTKINITENYSAAFEFISEDINILGKTMPIIIIVGWTVAIRECEYKNFISIRAGGKNIARSILQQENKLICLYLSKTGFSLNDLVCFPAEVYDCLINKWKTQLRFTPFIDTLTRCREIIQNEEPGQNIIRYLLYNMNNTIIKDQYNKNINNKLSGLYLKNKCIPFDTMPFINSPCGHNPRISTLFKCIPFDNRNHELLARVVRNNTEINGHLFTEIKKLGHRFANYNSLVQKYNNLLWEGHFEISKLVIEHKQIFINAYKNDTCEIIEKFRTLSNGGIRNYTESINEWLANEGSSVDSEEKKIVLRQMFAKSRVALVYGSAGVGKSTLINHVSNFFAKKEKLFLAQTNPAVDNLKRRVRAANCSYMTIAKYIRKNKIKREFDLVVIDECSTVSNREMNTLLNLTKFKLLLLVGDNYQIKSIRFGNWFSIAEKFISSDSVFHLNNPYRSKNDELLTLWKKVRNMNDDVIEWITQQGFSHTLDESIFERSEVDEIILCLNYDGLYGINNINRFLQENNPNPAIQWGIQQYKIGDPILFNESERFSPLIYNNMRGTIVDVKVFDEAGSPKYIQFDIELTNVINGLDAEPYDLELLDNSKNGNTVIRFFVYKEKNIDEDNELSTETVVPFQIAYAISIHKAQGLEYKSVKIVIAKEVGELITHNIFYTAITRAQEKLKIYWTPEVENDVLSNIKPLNINKDVNLLKIYLH